MIAGIVLSAGASERMGKPKALLSIGNETFLQRIIRIMRQARIQNIVVVLGAQSDLIQQSLSGIDGTIVNNLHWQQGQLTSLVAGLNSIEEQECHGVLVCPVDHPLLSQSLLVDLMQSFWKTEKNIIIPVYNGKRGHPVIWGTSMFDAIRNTPVESGARSVLRSYPDEVWETPVNEEGVLRNIDTPEDYQTYALNKTLW